MRTRPSMLHLVAIFRFVTVITTSGKGRRRWVENGAAGHIPSRWSKTLEDVSNVLHEVLHYVTVITMTWMWYELVRKRRARTSKVQDFYKEEPYEPERMTRIASSCDIPVVDLDTV